MLFESICIVILTLSAVLLIISLGFKFSNRRQNTQLARSRATKTCKKTDASPGSNIKANPEVSKAQADSVRTKSKGNDLDTVDKTSVTEKDDSKSRKHKEKSSKPEKSPNVKRKPPRSPKQEKKNKHGK